MFKDVIRKMLSQLIRLSTSIWHNFYFHWQLKDKTGYLLLSAFIFVIALIPVLTYQLVQYKNVQHDIKCLALNIYFLKTNGFSWQ